jgi:ABC-2 type transport system ATP-binding protein
MAEQGVTILVTTHYMDEAEYCERVGIMREGKLLAMDTPLKLKKQVVPGEVWEVFGEPLDHALAALPEIHGVLRFGLNGDHVRIITTSDLKKEELYGELKARNVNITNLVQEEPTLEDVFLSLAR